MLHPEAVYKDGVMWRRAVGSQFWADIIYRRVHVLLGIQGEIYLLIFINKRKTYVDNSVCHQRNGCWRIQRFNVNGLESDQFTLTDVFRIAHSQDVPFTLNQLQTLTNWKWNGHQSVIIELGLAFNQVSTHLVNRSALVKMIFTYGFQRHRISRNGNSHWHSHYKS